MSESWVLMDLVWMRRSRIVGRMEMEVVFAVICMRGRSGWWKTRGIWKLLMCGFW